MTDLWGHRARRGSAGQVLNSAKESESATSQWMALASKRARAFRLASTGKRLGLQDGFMGVGVVGFGVSVPDSRNQDDGLPASEQDTET